MERLTQTSDKGGVAFTFDLDVTCRLSEMKKILKLAEKLKAYEDAEEQGLQLRLPIAIGNIVYRINEYADEPIIPMGVTSIEIKGITDTFKEMKCKECAFGGVVIYRFSDIGKTVFLNRAEAEQALAEKGV